MKVVFQPSFFRGYVNLPGCNIQSGWKLYQISWEWWLIVPESKAVISWGEGAIGGAHWKIPMKINQCQSLTWIHPKFGSMIYGSWHRLPKITRRTLEVNESIHQPRQEKKIQVAVPNIDCQCMHHFESWDWSVHFCKGRLAYRFFWRPGSRWPPHKNISAWVMNHKYKPNINYINYIITRMIRP